MRFSRRRRALLSYLHQEGCVFGLVCLSVCQRDYKKSYCPSCFFYETLWEGEARAKEGHVKFWIGSKSQGGYANNYSLSLTLRDRALGLGEGLCSSSALLGYLIIYSFGKNHEEYIHKKGTFWITLRTIVIMRSSLGRRTRIYRRRSKRWEKYCVLKNEYTFVAFL